MGTRRNLTTSALATALALGPAAAAAGSAFPDRLPLPDGWLPEGIATGTGTTIYSGSRADGSVWRGDLRTGEGEVLVDVDGRFAVGMKVDRGLLFVAGGPTGDAYVYDARTGEEVAVLDLTDDPSFVNDVTVTRDAAYFTDSQAAVLYRVALGPGGAPTGEVDVLPLTGDWEQVAGFNANGIAATPDGGSLLVINSTTGILYSVDPASGEAVAVDTGGASLTSGDGILLQGPTLYVVRNSLDEVVELRMSPDLLSAEHVATLTDPDFDVPTTLAMHGSQAVCGQRPLQHPAHAQHGVRHRPGGRAVARSGSPPRQRTAGWVRTAGARGRLGGVSGRGRLRATFGSTPGERHAALRVRKARRPVNLIRFVPA